MSFRFGLNTVPSDQDRPWPEVVRSAEAQGYDLLLCPDHLGVSSPFGSLAAAAALTERIRLGSYVLNNEFWNPALLAREVATLSRLSGGRFELGLGVGHMKSEFDDAGIPWRRHAERVPNLRSTLDELDRRLSDLDPRPPLLIGGHGTTILTLAAERADVVAVSGLTQLPGRPPGTFGLAGSADTLERVDLVRAAAGPRAGRLELGVLVQAVIVTDDVERTAAELAERFGTEGMAEDEPLWQNPYLLIGTPDEMARTLIERRERFGFSHIVTHGASQDALAEVISAVRSTEPGPA
jgi:probable F420-dependent oxidoreductase